MFEDLGEGGPLGGLGREQLADEVSHFCKYRTFKNNYYSAVNESYLKKHVEQ